MLNITHIFCSKGRVTETVNSRAQTVPVNSAFNTSKGKTSMMEEGVTSSFVFLDLLDSLIQML